MSDIFDKTIFSLGFAKKMTEERILRFPRCGLYIHANDQIDFIARILAQNRSPSEVESDFIDIALMAIKALDSSEPEYADALCELSFWFKKL